MDLRGRRESSNVDDRRRLSGKAVGGMGIGGMIIAGIIVWIMGGDPTSVLQNSQLITNTESASAYEPSAEEEELATFAKQILAGTEDVWTAEFKKIFTSSVQSGCGGATSSTDPFYCSADQCVYLDLSFFLNMKKQLGADGDFAYAYVIAHEVGHHVQYLLGTLTEAHRQMNRVSEKKATK